MAIRAPDGANKNVNHFSSSCFKFKICLNKVSMKESYDPVDSHKNQSQQGVVHQGKPKEKIKEISDYKGVPHHWSLSL